MNKVEIFWSGGIDSSFRMVELSQQELEIRSYYIKGLNWRKSVDYELNAIAKITKTLMSDPRTKAKINDIVIVDKAPKNREVTTAYRRIYTKMLEEAREKGHVFRPSDKLNHVNSGAMLSSQWQLLGAFAKNHCGIEVAFAGMNDFSVLALLNSYGRLEKRKVPQGINWEFVPNGKNNDMLPIMENIRITSLEYETKASKCEKLISDGYEEVLNAAWLCYDPIEDAPCGCCFPCIHAIRDGVPHSYFGEAAMERYHKREAEIKDKI